jgi:sugar lactone lactonase YvrE
VTPRLALASSLLSVTVLCPAVLSIAPRADGQNVVTVAGGGAGDGGPATSAGLGQLGGLVVDSSGNAFFADVGHRSIRRVDRATGAIATILRLEEKDAPRFLALHGPGRLLFTSQLRVEEVDLGTGRRRTVAGNGRAIWRGGVIEEGRPATQVALGPISGLAVGQGGDVYFGDPARALLFRVDPATGLLGRVLVLERPGGSEAMENVYNLAIDAAGRLHFSDQRHHRIFRLEGGRPIVVAGDGTRGQKFPREGARVGEEDDARAATSSPLDLPGPLAFRSADDLFFGEAHGTVRRVNRFERIKAFLGPTISASEVSGVAFDRDGTLLVASHPAFGVGQVLKVPGASGAPEVLAGSGIPHCCGDGAAAVEAELAEPEGVAIAPDGDLVIADRANHRIRRVSSRTGRIATIAGGGEFALPGSRHVVFHRVRSAPPPGRIHAKMFEILEPRFVAADLAGNLYFAQQDGPVYRIDAGDGTLFALCADRKNAGGPKSPDGFAGIGGIAVDPAGTVFVAAEHRIWRILAGGGIGVVAGTGHEGFAGDGDFALPADLSRPGWPVVDGGGTLYFVDTGNSRIRRVDRSGRISTIAGNGLGFASGEGQAIRESIGAARGLTLDPLGNLVYSTADNRIWRLTLADGKLRLVAGGEPSAIRPLAVAFDRRGTLYFSEPDSSRVSAIRP